jgi:hypothetical protein
VFSGAKIVLDEGTIRLCEVGVGKNLGVVEIVEGENLVGD